MLKQADSDRMHLFGGIAALAIALLYVVSGVITAIGYQTSPVPGETSGWFTLFQTNPLLGLVYLGIQDFAIAILAVPLFFALYQALKSASKTWSILAAAFAMIGIAMYLSMHTSISMLSLSSQYARAATDARRAILLIGAQALLADPRPGFGMVIIWASALIFSVIMLKSRTFGRFTAIIGIVGFALLLLGAGAPAGYTNTGPLTPFETVITALSIGGGGPLSLLWFLLAGLKLIRIKGPQPVQFE